MKKLDPETEEKRERKRRIRTGGDPLEGSPPPGPGQTFRGSTGYTYTRGGPTPHHVNKRDWDAMSQEERDAIGVPDFETLQRINRGWRSGFAEGGGNFQNQSRIADILRGQSINSEADLARALNSAGVFNAKDEGQALFRRLMGAFRGDIDPSGRYHRVGNQWADQGTSDLAKAGIAGAADYWGAGAGGGLASVLAGLAGGGKDEQGYFDRLVSEGDWTEWPPGSGQYFNDPGNDPSRRVWVDRNNLQAQGSGYKSRMGAGEGPELDYSKIAPGQTIAQYLSGQYQTDKNMADYWKRASEAAPYITGTGGATTPEPQPGPTDVYTAPAANPTFGAWGVQSSTSANRQRQPNAMMGAVPQARPVQARQPRPARPMNPNMQMPQQAVPQYRYKHGAL